MDYINDPGWDDEPRYDPYAEEYDDRPGWGDEPPCHHQAKTFDSRPAGQRPPQSNPGCLASLFGIALFDRLMFPADEEGFDDFLDDLFF